jgi:CubicO group peptidase (beta-lactamase class C family)
MIDRRLFLFAGASTFAHVGKTVVVPTVSQSLRGVLDASGVPALGYAVIGAKGVVRMEVSGRRRANDDAAATAEDLWHIGSNTEAMTSALYARLVESGRTIWGASVPLLFPDLKIDPAWQDVSIEEFLAHRSGASDVGIVDEGWLIAVNADRRPLPEQRTAMVQRLLARPPAGRRHDYEYASVDYVVAGAAIERLTGTSWEEALTQEVFTPLGMADAGFGAPVGACPWGHEVGRDGELEAVDPVKGVADNPKVLAPGGQVHVSLEDYARFIGVFLKNGGGYLKPESLMRLARPEDALMEGDALGWRVTPVKAWAEGPVLAHEGSNTLWRTLAEVAPARSLGLVVVTNAGGEAGARAVQMMSARLLSEESKEDDG